MSTVINKKRFFQSFNIKIPALSAKINQIRQKPYLSKIVYVDMIFSASSDPWCAAKLCKYIILSNEYWFIVTY